MFQICHRPVVICLLAWVNIRNYSSLPGFYTASIAMHGSTGDWIQNQPPLICPMFEVEHIGDRRRITVKRAYAAWRCHGSIDEPQIPIVLDEAQDRDLIGQRVVDKV